jgi:hypothetical protein
VVGGVLRMKETSHLEGSVSLSGEITMEHKSGLGGGVESTRTARATLQIRLSDFNNGSEQWD